MRLDKFLKTTRIIKRRTIAQELCEACKVIVNGDAKKPAYSVKKGDLLEISYFNKVLKAEVLEVPTENLKKEDIENYIKFIN